MGRLLTPRSATRVTFHDAQGGAIDTGLALHFPRPHSYTGEDVVEWHGHGGPAVMRMLLARCLELGARLAAPGEFTKRAFLNGKLDLQVSRVLEVGDLALVVGEWSFTGTTADGQPVKLAARNADVLRRQADRSWRFVIDNPWGTE